MQVYYPPPTTTDPLCRHHKGSILQMIIFDRPRLSDWPPRISALYIFSGQVTSSSSCALENVTTSKYCDGFERNKSTMPIVIHAAINFEYGKSIHGMSYFSSVSLKIFSEITTSELGFLTTLLSLIKWLPHTTDVCSDLDWKSRTSSCKHASGRNNSLPPASSHVAPAASFPPPALVGIIQPPVTPAHVVELKPVPPTMLLRIHRRPVLLMHRSSSNTPPAGIIQPPVTLRIHRRGPVAPVAPLPPPPQPITPQPAERHLLVCQPLNPSINVAHSLGPMDSGYFSLLLPFSY